MSRGEAGATEGGARAVEDARIHSPEATSTPTEEERRSVILYFQLHVIVRQKRYSSWVSRVEYRGLEPTGMLLAQSCHIA